MAKLNMKKSLSTLIITACLSTAAISANAATNVQKNTLPASGIDTNYTYRNTFDSPSTLDRAERNAERDSMRNSRYYFGDSIDNTTGDTVTCNRLNRRSFRRNAFNNGFANRGAYRYRSANRNNNLYPDVTTNALTLNNNAMSMQNPAALPNNITATSGISNTTPTTTITGTTAAPTATTSTATVNPAGLTTAGSPSTAAANTATTARNANTGINSRTSTPNSRTIYNASSTMGGISRSGISSPYYNPVNHDATVRVPNTAATTTRNTAHTGTRSTANLRTRNVAPAATTYNDTPSGTAGVTRATNNKTPKITRTTRSVKGNTANHNRTRNTNLHVNADTNKTHIRANTNKPAVTRQNAQTRTALNNAHSPTRTARPHRNNAVAHRNANQPQATTAYRNSVNNTRGYRNTNTNTTARAVGDNSVYEHYEYTARYPANNSNTGNTVIGHGTLRNRTMTNGQQHTANRTAVNTRNTGVNRYQNNTPDGTYRDFMTDGVYRNTNVNSNNRNTNTHTAVNRADRTARVDNGVRGGLYRNNADGQYRTADSRTATRTTIPSTPAVNNARNTRPNHTGSGFRAVTPERTTNPATRMTNNNTRNINNTNRAVTPARLTRNTDTTNATNTSITFIVLTIAIVLLLALSIFALMRPRRTEYSDNDMANRRR